MPAPLTTVAAAPAFAYGDLVVVGGLTSKTGRLLNGRDATVLRGPDPANDGRVECHFRGRDATVAMLPERLTKKFPGYAVRRSTTHGLGLFATRSFVAGETICAESPLIRGEDNPDADDLSASDWRLLKQLAPCNVPPETAADDPALSRGSLTELGQIRNANIFQLAGLCPVLSRANHACDARAQFEWDPETSREVLYAIAPIAEGDEIFVTYTEDFATTTERQAKLLREKSFTCSCPLCSLPPPEREARDSAVARLKELHATIPSAAERGYEAVKAVALEAIALCDALGYVEQMIVPAMATEMIDAAVQREASDAELLYWAKLANDTLHRRSSIPQWDEKRQQAAACLRDVARFRRQHCMQLMRQMMQRSRSGGLSGA